MKILNTQKEFEKELNEVYKKYNKKVNMTYTELLIWSNNPCSRKASLNRLPIIRNLRLLSLSKSKWGRKEIFNANKTISFISRMKKVKAGKKECNGLSKKTISLMNWGFNINK